MSVSIKVENLSKLYRLGEIGTGTLSRDIERWFKMSVLGQEDPFLKIGQTNDRTITGSSDVIYSLQNINFEVEQGETVGIIGRNGAGKSTLLKVLSRITSPSTGFIRVKGRVASLLEVGTGFHPELTGKENIFLNGAILGMRKKEISKKLDEIIDFSGVERFIDTPVKRYSSGMYVRLAFAVAAHLDSEVLIVDEVLAVGDAEFQKKCLGKMNEVSKGEGRTVLFVSHNMNSILKLCEKSIILDNGFITAQGNSEKIVSLYRASDHIHKLSQDNLIIREDIISMVKLETNSTDGKFSLSFSVESYIDIPDIRVGIYFYNENEDIMGSYIAMEKSDMFSMSRYETTKMVISFAKEILVGRRILYKFWIKSASLGVLLKSKEFGVHDHNSGFDYPLDGGFFILNPEIKIVK